MLETAKKLDVMGVNEMRIIRTTEAPRWVQNAGDACLTFEEYFDKTISLWQQYASEAHDMALTVWQFGTLYPKTKFYTLAAVNSCKGKYRASAPVCKGNRGMVAVAANGNLYPCHQMSGYYEQHGFFLGNVKKTPLKDFLSGGKYLEEVCTTLGTLNELMYTFILPFHKNKPKARLSSVWLCMGFGWTNRNLFYRGLCKYTISTRCTPHSYIG